MGIFGSKPDPRIAQLVAQTNQLTQLMAKQQQHLLKLTEKLFDLSKPPPPKPDVPEETRQEVWCGVLRPDVCSPLPAPRPPVCANLCARERRRR